MESTNNIEDAPLFALALRELETDTKDVATWAQAFSQADGDRERAWARYLQLRVEVLKYRKSRSDAQSFSAFSAPDETGAAVTGGRPDLDPTSMRSSESGLEEHGSSSMHEREVGETAGERRSELVRDVRSSNYVLRHWRGELSLPVSYWINGSIVGYLLSKALVGLDRSLLNTEMSLRLMVVPFLGFFLCFCAYYIWSIVGIWRSAENRIRLGKGSGWARTAQIAISLAALAVAGNLVKYIIPNSVELIKIGFGNDPVGSMKVVVSANGQAVILEGAFGAGTAAKVTEVLDAAPGIKTLMLNSNGGRTVEAERLAMVVEMRGLNTYVEGSCESACTYVFLAGKDRAATPNAKIGFHQPSTARGTGLRSDAEEVARMAGILRNRGLPEAFVQHATSTSFDDMWYPTRSELLEARVVTRTSLGDEVTSPEDFSSKAELLRQLKENPIFAAMERRYPGSINEACDKAWAAHERGASLGDVISEARQVISEKSPIALKEASPALLQDFLGVLLAELSDAHAAGPHACVQFIDGAANSRHFFTERVNRDDQAFTLRLFSEEGARGGPVSDRQFRPLARLVLAQLTDREQSIFTNRASPPASEEERCMTMIEFYSQVNLLPEEKKIVVLRGFFQGTN